MLGSWAVINVVLGRPGRLGAQTNRSRATTKDNAIACLMTRARWESGP